MKILCVSDQIDPLVYSNSAKERFEDVDLVICAGDLPREYIDFIVTVINKPTYFVFGNHNLKELPLYHPNECPQSPFVREVDRMKYATGARYLGFKVEQEGPLLLAGASGSLRYNNGLCQYTERQMHFRLLKMVPKLLRNRIRYGRYLDLFITHTPPKGIHDKPDRCHQGFECYRWFLKTFKPAYMIHGHIHLYDLQAVRVSKFEETTVINAFSHYLLEFDKPIL